MGASLSAYVPCLEPNPDIIVRIEYCDSSSFLDKAKHITELLKKRSEKMLLEENKYVKLNIVTEGISKGKMDVFLNDENIFSKKAISNVKNPQPTPSQIGSLIEDVFPDYHITPEESAAIFKLHNEHISRGSVTNL